MTTAGIAKAHLSFRELTAARFDLEVLPVFAEFAGRTHRNLLPFQWLVLRFADLKTRLSSLSLSMQFLGQDDRFRKSAHRLGKRRLSPCR